jgi:putative nucleotidyltransferase with HDIG domain
MNKLVKKTFKIIAIEEKPKYLDLTLLDDSKKIKGILKDNVNMFLSMFSVNDKIICLGKYFLKENETCFDIVQVNKYYFEQKEERFVDIEDYKSRFIDIIDSIEDADYKKILHNCFTEDICEMFYVFPSSMIESHNYSHGLLKHSVEVVETAVLLANYYKNVNIDLLKCAGLLHDIGKLKSYEIDENEIITTNWEKRLSHQIMSTLFLSKVITSELEQEKALLLYSIVCNHHSESKTVEETILQKVDELSIFCDKFSKI